MLDNPFQSPGSIEFQQPNPAWRVPWVKILVGLGVLCLLVPMFLPSHRGGRSGVIRNACRNNLKQIGIALLNYKDEHGSYPPAYTVDAAGKPLHSWRTLLLPYLEEQALYKTIDLTKPWDDPVNAKALNTAIGAFLCPATDLPANHTGYLAVVTPQSCLRVGTPTTAAEITDGADKTVVVVEVPNDKSVPWMSPQDVDENYFVNLLLDPDLKNDAGQPVTRPHPGDFCHVVFADAHVEAIDPEKTVAERRAMITISGKD